MGQACLGAPASASSSSKGSYSSVGIRAPSVRGSKQRGAVMKSKQLTEQRELVERKSMVEKIKKKSLTETRNSGMEKKLISDPETDSRNSYRT